MQISDVHVGAILGAAFIKRIVEISNSLSPDLVALTGDLVDGTVEQMDSAFTGFQGLRAPSGVFSVTGNHEYYWGAPEWIAFQKALGIRVLLNEHEVVRKEGAALVIAGVTDAGADLEKALAGLPVDSGVKKILLAHRPDCYEKADKLGFDVQLSGHTHGGQFFPWSVFVAIAHRYYKGLARIGQMCLYVNRGTGFWGPPVRFGVPSEITLLKLKSI
ncbi:metallophosphoesterase [Bdellovibrionota bacterium FG-2]